MTELRQLFFETAAELVQKLNEEAMQLEQSPSDAEAARSLRRTVHTLKVTRPRADSGSSANCAMSSRMCWRWKPGHRRLGSRHRVARCRCLCGHAGGLPERHGTPQHRVFTSGDRPSGAPGRQRRGKSKSKARKPSAKRAPWSEYEQLAIAQAVSEGKRVHHVVVESTPSAACPSPPVR